MPNVQQPEMRRRGQTRLVQDSDGPVPGGRGTTGREHRSVQPDQVSPYGPQPDASVTPEEPRDRAVEGD